MKEFPEQVAQSGWHATQEPEELNELEGQDVTQLPDEASLLSAQVRQKSAEPAQVPQEEEQAVQVTLSLGSMKVPLGQLSTHLPDERK